MSESIMNYVVKLLNTYRGRDSIIRTMSYFSLYLSDQTGGSTSQKLKTINKELCHYRLLSRLFDDFPMLQYTLNYGLGSKKCGTGFENQSRKERLPETLIIQNIRQTSERKKGTILQLFQEINDRYILLLQIKKKHWRPSNEEHIVARVLGVLKNLLDQIYFPVEHAAWAADQKIITAKSSYFYILGTVLWGLSSYIGVVKSLIMMSVLQRKTQGLKNVVLHEKIVGKQLELLLLAFQEAADVVLAVNYLPPGSLLWAGRLKQKEIGLIGTFSSLMRLLMLFRHMKNNNEIVS